jgi:hypothetical protein
MTWGRQSSRRAGFHAGFDLSAQALAPLCAIKVGARQLRSPISHHPYTTTPSGLQELQQRRIENLRRFDVRYVSQIRQ